MLVGRHFADRMPSEYWMIVDDKRKTVCVHPKDGENYLRYLTDGEFENVMWFMRTPKFCLAVIHIVFALAQFEIDDVDGIDFTHLVVGASQPNIFRDGL